MENRTNVLIVGNNKVGKVSLLRRHISGLFPEEYVPELFNNSKTFNFEGKDIIYYPIVSSGSDDLKEIRKLSYPSASVFILCFSVAERKSFEDVDKKWIHEIREECERTPILLVGTCTDLMNTSGKEKSEFVSQKEGDEKARQIGAVGYIECSSKENINVNKVFETAVVQAISYKKKSEYISNMKGGCNIF